VTAAAPVAGGWVVAHASWRWLFLVNVPLAAAAIALAVTRVPESRDPTATGRIDVPGAALVTVSLALVVYALVDAGDGHGIGGARSLGLLGAGAVAMAAFVWVELRSRAPMVDFALFRSPTFLGTNLLTLLLYGALGGGLFFLPFDLIQVQHYSPTAAGAAFLPFVFLISVMSRSVGALAGRIGARPLLVVGALVAAGGFVLLAVPAVGGSYWTTFFPGVVVLGAGMGVVVAPLTAAVMGSVDRRHAGVASGINNAVARAAGLLALAALGVVLVTRYNSALDGRLARIGLGDAALELVNAQRSRLAAADLSVLGDGALRDAVAHAIDDSYVDGFRTLALVCAALALLASVGAFALVGREKARRGSAQGVNT
jgi:MFS family permease